MTKPEICEVGGTDQGLLLPIGGEDEARWPGWLKCILYLIGLLWCFMGVAIIADVFMGAIERVTSKKKRIMNPQTGKEFTVKVWNDTVANLTLMALGSSAPEILLNIKEIFENRYYSGALGPMTIVGSAAFNLMVIIAVCVSAIPSGESRKIKDVWVYAVTAVFSIFAYLWLLFILMGPSPNAVDVPEGVSTFLFFFVLVSIAYLADVRIENKKKADGHLVHPDSKEEMEEMATKVRQKYGNNLTDNQVAALIDFECAGGQTRSRAFHRVNATRALFKGKQLKGDSSYEEGRAIARKSKDPLNANAPTIGFVSSDHVCLESQGTVKLEVARWTNLEQEIVVHYSTQDGSAKEGEDFVRTEGELTFKAGETSQFIEVGIVEDKEGFEETEHFWVVLTKAEKCTAPQWGGCKARVSIVDENHPGKISFEQEKLEVFRPTENARDLEITILRKRGWDGKVNIDWCTENETAYGGADFEEGEGTVEFEHGQREAKLKVTLLPKKDGCDGNRTEEFRVVLRDSTKKTIFDETTDGGEDSCILTVFLKNRGGVKRVGTNIYDAFRLNHDQISIGHAKWRDQFVSAVYCNGDAEGMEEATVSDWIVHIIVLPWKVFFACVPPVEYAGGWICFFVSLLAIGFVTVLIGDLAALLGCAFGISPFATAITFVALGTSLPDTFASKSAAVQDDTADASIGNVTGSNSVNVFLGLGLPWAIGSIYWKVVGAEPGSEWYSRYKDDGDIVTRYPDGAFIVKSDGLGMSVAVFSACSVTCIGCLALRRQVFGAELGGPDSAKWATSAFFVLLWLGYVAFSIASQP